MFEVKTTYIVLEPPSCSPLWTLHNISNNIKQITPGGCNASDNPIFQLDTPSDLIQWEVGKSPCRWLVTMRSRVIWVLTCIDIIALIEHGDDEDLALITAIWMINLISHSYHAMIIFIKMIMTIQMMKDDKVMIHDHRWWFSWSSQRNTVHLKASLRISWTLDGFG